MGSVGVCLCGVFNNVVMVCVAAAATAVSVIVVGENAN